MTTELRQPPPTLPGLDPVATVHELQPQQRRPHRRTTAGLDAPAPPDDVTSALVEAVDRVHRVVTARIAWHEEQLRQLHEALKPFAGLPGTSGAAMTDTDVARELLALAKQLPLGDDTTPGD